MNEKDQNAVGQRVRDLVLADFKTAPHRAKFPRKPLWERVKHCGTELWLDTGDIDEAASLWCKEFTALTTNNTLLNKEVQKGIYDDLVEKVAGELRGTVSDEDLVLEIAFILNAYHGLRLSRQFGAKVSVELHTALSYDADRMCAYGRRYHEISPDSFYVKVALTPAGLVAARRLVEEGIAVNFTLGFSARQNYVMAAFSRPAFVNVFLGRLNSFVSDNKLGSGEYVGEKATLSSQRAVTELRRTLGIATRQIAASIRAGKQIETLSGVDVMTIPVKAAREFEALNPSKASVHSRTADDPEVELESSVDRGALGIDALWDVPDDFKKAVGELLKLDAAAVAPEDIAEFFTARGYRDFLPEWSVADIQTATSDGKIPKLERWTSRLASREVGLDALMNLSGLQSFDTDQKAMDERVRSML